MKPTNRKIWLTVAIVAAIVLIADFILLLAFGAISGTVFGITALISGPLAIIPMMFLIAPDEMKKQWNNADIARQGFLPRTKESTVFEIASAFILIASWVVAIARPNEEIYIIYDKGTLQAHNCSGNCALWLTDCYPGNQPDFCQLDFSPACHL